MYRQIVECISVRSMQSKGSLILNKKEEYSRSILPQLEVPIGGNMMAKKDGLMSQGLIGPDVINQKPGKDLDDEKVKKRHDSRND